MTRTSVTTRTIQSLALAASLALPGLATADVKLPTIFSDHMVLQQDFADPVWGTASPDEKVTVKVGDQEASAAADKDGKWMVKLKPLSAGGPLEMSVAGRNTITIKDVLVGEVWVCSGQSNMGMTVNGVKDKAKEIAEANHPQIRMFHVPNIAVDEPASDVPNGSWTVCSPAVVGNYSAAAYFFGRDLQEGIKRPVGLINTSWGGTRIEPWISGQSLAGDQYVKEEFEKYKNEPALSPEDAKKYSDAMNKWRVEANEAKKEKKPAPPAVPAPAGKIPNQPGFARLYNGMVNPLIPYGIKGALWYQGESNGGEGVKYRTWLPEMIGDWRTHWNQPGNTHDFPFLIVQLPNNGAPSPAGAESVGWTLIREAEMQTAEKLPNVGTAVTIDTSSDGDLHPPEKQPVGHRLALIAEHRFYGMDVPDSGPVLGGTKADGDKLTLTFKETHGGLVAHGEKLTGFYVAGEDRKFFPADATIDGDSVILHSAEVAKPVAARYAWAQNPKCNLFNKADLPAGPFRTDDWDGAKKQ